MGLGAVARVVAGPEEAEGLAADAAVAEGQAGAAVARPGAEVVPAAVVAAPAVKAAPAAVVVAARRAVQVEEELPGPAIAVGGLTRINPALTMYATTQMVPLQILYACRTTSRT
jgi:hypothetical protein